MSTAQAHLDAALKVAAADLSQGADPRIVAEEFAADYELTLEQARALLDRACPPDERPKAHWRRRETVPGDNVFLLVFFCVDLLVGGLRLLPPDTYVLGIRSDDGFWGMAFYALGLLWLGVALIWLRRHRRPAKKAATATS
jgi:hypothetical protein